MEKIKVSYRKGDLIRVINPDNYYYDQIAEVTYYNEYYNRVAILFENGHKTEVGVEDVIKNLSHKEQRKLQKAFLNTLINLSLDLKDEQWFMEITSKLKREFSL